MPDGYLKESDLTQLSGIPLFGVSFILAGALTVLRLTPTFWCTRWSRFNRGIRELDFIVSLQNGGSLCVGGSFPFHGSLVLSDSFAKGGALLMDDSFCVTGCSILVTHC